MKSRQGDACLIIGAAEASAPVERRVGVVPLVALEPRGHELKGSVPLDIFLRNALRDRGVVSRFVRIFFPRKALLLLLLLLAV